MLRKLLGFASFLLPKYRALRNYNTLCFESGDHDSRKAIRIALTDPKWKKALILFHDYSWDLHRAESLSDTYEDDPERNEEICQEYDIALKQLKETAAWVLSKGPNPFSR